MRSELTLDQAADALRHVDPDCDRDTWIRMAMALKAEFGDSAWDTWDAWSQGGQSYNARQARTQWRSLSTHGAVTIASLIHEAKANGWQPPQAADDPAERERRQKAAEERQQVRRAEAEAEAQREAAWQERVAEIAEQAWARLGSVGRSKYLGAKRVQAHGLGFAKRGLLLVVDEDNDRCELIEDRVQIRGWFADRPASRDGLSIRYLRPGTLAVPMRDIDGGLWGLQLIFAGGAKKFLRGQRKKGTFHLLGELSPEHPICIAEGYATGASIHEATGWPVAVCWDAGNIAPVAEALRERWPGARLLICGDDDHEAVDSRGNPANAGRMKACDAAGRSGGVAVFPRFQAPAGQSDWNDLHVAEGLEAVRTQLLKAPHQEPVGEASEPPGGEEPPPPDGPPPGLGADQPAGADDPDWGAQLVRSREGAVKATLHNLITVLEHHPDWSGVFALDRFANEVRKLRSPPYQAPPGPLGDVDGTEVAAWFGRPSTYSMSVGSGAALEAVEAVASRHAFHPVLSYLDGLRWDGTPRLDRMLADYFGAADNEYTYAVAANWLMSAVKRVRDPGCKVDFMVILEGDQGRGKSTAVRALCGSDWFAEMLESPQNKDFYQLLAGRWMIEIPELQAFNKADRNKIKAAISAQEDTYRPSYGRYARQFPRQNIFVGTTNDDAYLKDETGARRFLPIRVGWCEIEALTRIRDQLWAEADYRVAQGESWWQFPAQAEEEQAQRFDSDAWQDPISQWLDGESGADAYPHIERLVNPDRPVEETTITDVMRYALDVEIAKQSKPDQMRVGGVLRALGWRRRQTRQQGRRMYVYVRPREAG